MESFDDLRDAFFDWMCGANYSSRVPVLRGNLLSGGLNLQLLLYDTCIVDTMTSIPHVFAIVLFSLVLIGLRCCCCCCCAVPKRSSGDETGYLLKFPGHGRRWLLSSILQLLLVGAAVEGVLTDATYRRPTQPHLYIPDACAFLATVLAARFNQQIEKWRMPAMVWLLLTYWVATSGSNALYLFHIASLQLSTPGIATFDIAVAVSALQLLLLLNEVNVIRLKIVFHRSNMAGLKDNVSEVPSDLQNNDMYYIDEHCNTFSRITFSWLGRLLKIGFQRRIDVQDLGSLPEIHNAHFCHKRFSNVMKQEKILSSRSGRSARLWVVCLRTYWWDIVTTGLLRLVAELVRLINPLAIRGIVLYITAHLRDAAVVNEQPHFLTTSELFSNGFVLVGVMFVSVVVRSVCLTTYFHWTTLMSLHAFSAIQAAVFEKSLRLTSSCNGRGPCTVNHITSYISTDADNIYCCFTMLHQSWIIPLVVLLTILLLYVELGMSALLCVILMVVALFVHLKIACLTAKVQKRVMLFSVERVKKCKEMFQGIKLLKMYGWEQLHCESIAETRNGELSQIVKINTLLAVSNILSIVFPFFISLVAFGSYTTFSGQHLTPDVTFSTFVLFNIMMNVIYKFATALVYYINGIISSRRLQDFLSSPEVDKRWKEEVDNTTREYVVSVDTEPLSSLQEESKGPSNVTIKRTRSFLRRQADTRSGSLSSASPSEDGDNWSVEEGMASNVIIKIENGWFTWQQEGTTPVLSNINVDIPAGRLTVVVGPLGSGKSSLVQVILGEMRRLHGTVKIRKKRSTIAYASQEPWLIHGSLRENILFGLPYHSKRYRKVLKACALETDIEILPEGDLTVIGGKRFNLSKGQKQRVSVARAIYSERNIVILDDALSCLDMRIGTHVFEKGLIRMMRRTRQTVILVTHHLQCLRKADHIIVMKDGKIDRQGSRQEIARLNPILNCGWKRAVHLTNESETESEVESDTMKEEQLNLLKQVSMQRVVEGEDKADADGTPSEYSEMRLEIKPVSYKIYVYFLRAVRCKALLLIAAVYLIRESFRVAASFWLSSWSSTGLHADNNGPQGHSLNLYYLIGYAAITLACILSAIVASVTLAYSGILAAKQLHAGMLRNIIKAPMRFFETTPVKRILHRFSDDIAVIDRSIRETADNILFYLLSCLSAVAIISIVMPTILVAFLPVCLCYLFVHKYFVASERALRQLESNSRSPIVDHVTETLGGLVTIRAYSAERRFLQRAYQLITTHATARAYLLCAYRWNEIRSDMLGSLLLLVTGMCTTYAAIYGELDPSLAALAISYILSSTCKVSNLVRYTNDIVMHMNAVERVQQFSAMPVERNEPGTSNPPADWPDKGHVEFRDVSLRYAEDLPIVMRDINVEFRPGQKVALCGQTGSGKTSLALSLFRILDICQGHVNIDGVDITTIPIETVRRSLSIIPQDPQLFTGSIKHNLDPECLSTDMELWNALEIVQLKWVMSSLKKTLDSEAGDDFSDGQRQLFCLARAYLRKSRILVIDEAVVSMDTDADTILQEVVASRFSACTVITIVHRLSTIMTFDTVLVLSNGEIIERGSPHVLIGRDGGVLAAMARGSE